MHVSAALAILLVAMALPSLSAPIVFPRDILDLREMYQDQLEQYKPCGTLLARKEGILSRGEKLLARHGSSGGRPHSLADIHVAWALHRQTLDDEEVAAVHDAYRGTPAPHTSQFPSHHGQSNEHLDQQGSQSTPRELVEVTAREPSINSYSANRRTCIFNLCEARSIDIDTRRFKESVDITFPGRKRAELNLANSLHGARCMSSATS